MRTEKGSVILEYALTISLIAVVAMFALVHTGEGVSRTFFHVGDSLQLASAEGNSENEANGNGEGEDANGNDSGHEGHDNKDRK